MQDFSLFFASFVSCECPSHLIPVSHINFVHRSPPSCSIFTPRRGIICWRRFLRYFPQEVHSRILHRAKQALDEREGTSSGVLQVSRCRSRSQAPRHWHHPPHILDDMNEYRSSYVVWLMLFSLWYHINMPLPRYIYICRIPWRYLLETHVQKTNGKWGCTYILDSTILLTRGFFRFIIYLVDRTDWT